MSEFAARWLFGDGLAEGTPLSEGGALDRDVFAHPEPPSSARSSEQETPQQDSREELSPSTVPRGRVEEVSAFRLSRTPQPANASPEEPNLSPGPEPASVKASPGETDDVDDQGAGELPSVASPNAEASAAGATDRAREEPATETPEAPASADIDSPELRHEGGAPAPGLTPEATNEDGRMVQQPEPVPVRLSRRTTLARRPNLQRLEKIPVTTPAVSHTDDQGMASRVEPDRSPVGTSFAARILHRVQQFFGKESAARAHEDQPVPAGSSDSQSGRQERSRTSIAIETEGRDPSLMRQPRPEPAQEVGEAEIDQAPEPEAETLSVTEAESQLASLSDGGGEELASVPLTETSKHAVFRLGQEHDRKRDESRSPEGSAASRRPSAEGQRPVVQRVRRHPDPRSAEETSVSATAGPGVARESPARAASTPLAEASPTTVPAGPSLLRSAVRRVSRLLAREDSTPATWTPATSTPGIEVGRPPAGRPVYRQVSRLATTRERTPPTAPQGSGSTLTRIAGRRHGQPSDQEPDSGTVSAPLSIPSAFALDSPLDAATPATERLERPRVRLETSVARTPAQLARAQAPGFSRTSATKLATATGTPIRYDTPGTATVTFAPSAVEDGSPAERPPEDLPRLSTIGRADHEFVARAEAASTQAVPTAGGGNEIPATAEATGDESGDLDVDDLYDQVVERLRRELLFERERMGDLLGDLP